MKAEQIDRMRTGEGFIAALDQSGGSTPKALGLYGVGAEAWSSDEEMFDLIHAMRARMMMSRAFDSRVLGAILFEMTMDRVVDGLPTAEYLWSRKGILPFLKVDQGLAEPSGGVQVMKDMPDLEALLERAVAAGIFGTKMRSVIAAASPEGIDVVTITDDELGHEWEWENVPECTVAVVADVDDAVERFNRWSPHFVCSVITTSDEVVEQVYATVDAPFVGDGFTRWVDGQYALRAPELGLSNWENGRLLGRSAILSGSSVHTVRHLARFDDHDIRR